MIERVQVPQDQILQEVRGAGARLEPLQRVGLWLALAFFVYNPHSVWHDLSRILPLAPNPGLSGPTIQPWRS